MFIHDNSLSTCRSKEKLLQMLTKLAFPLKQVVFKIFIEFDQNPSYVSFNVKNTCTCVLQFSTAVFKLRNGFLANTFNYSSTLLDITADTKISIVICFC